MRRKWIQASVAAAAVMLAASSPAAAPGGAGPREGLLESVDLSRLGVGADYEWFRRDVVFAGGAGREMDARRISGVVSWDLAPWVSLFATVGSVETRLLAPEYGESEQRWSAGLHARFWHTDVEDPVFLAGRLSIDSTLELSRSTFDDTASHGHWTEQFAALTVAYEIFVDTIENRERVPFSLRLYAGPAFSRIDGRATTAAGRSDFDEASDVGATWGAELFISHNLSVGYGAQYFDRTTSLATLRYRF